MITTGVLNGTYDCGPGADVVYASWLWDGTPDERLRDEQRLFPDCETVLRRLTDAGYVDESRLVGRGANAALLKAGADGRRAKLDRIDSAYAAQPRRRRRARRASRLTFGRRVIQCRGRRAR